MSSNLLARFAEATYWMARYVERAENVARILDVNETFSRDSRGAGSWLSVLQLNGDGERFFATRGEATAAAVIHFYTLDAANPTSIVSDLRMARENARTLRPLISTEMWTQLNVFYNRVRATPPADLAEPRLARLCAFVKEGCQTHAGITEGTFYRDEGWHFAQIGRALERADQTTRLLDVKYHHLLPTPEAVGSPVDVSQWNALLRSAAAYHAFRRVFPSGMTPAHVAGFLLHNRAFPRSVTACVAEAAERLAELRTGYDLEGGAAAAETLDDLQRSLDIRPIGEVVRRGLHEFLDDVQLRLSRASTELGRDFFGYALAEPAGSEG